MFGACFGSLRLDEGLKLGFAPRFSVYAKLSVFPHKLASVHTSQHVSPEVRELEVRGEPVHAADEINDLFPVRQVDVQPTVGTPKGFEFPEPNPSVPDPYGALNLPRQSIG